MSTLPLLGFQRIPQTTCTPRRLIPLLTKSYSRSSYGSRKARSISNFRLAWEARRVRHVMFHEKYIWARKYRQAVLEPDATKLYERIECARRQIDQRMQYLRRKEGIVDGEGILRYSGRSVRIENFGRNRSTGVAISRAGKSF